MTTQQVTITLPEPVFRQFLQMAEATQQSVESLIAQSVVSNLPPSADQASPELRGELLRMQTLSIEALLEIAQAQAEPEQYQRHSALLEKQQEEGLTPDERQEVADLRAAADRLMLRKAYAWSILRWRGYRLPALNELAVPA